MNKAANFWTDSRLSAQRSQPRVMTLPARGTAEELSAIAAATRDVAKKGEIFLPPWVYFCMVMVATFALCVTVTMRTHAEMQTAEERFETINTDVTRLRDTNQSLRRQLERLRTDPRAIETAARIRLNMVRANEIVVPLN